MSFFKDLSLKIRFVVGSLFYLTYTLHSIRYSMMRDRLERKFLKPATEGGFDSPGKLLQAEPTERGARFYFEQAELEIDFLTADFARVNWQPGILPIPYAIARREWEDVKTNLQEIPDGWKVSSDGLSVTVGIDGSLRWSDATGKILREELPPQKKPEGWIHKAQLRKEESIYGLGERSAPLDVRRPKDGRVEGKYRMWNYDAAGMYGPGSDPMYICIPVYLGLHEQGSYLIFYENSFEACFTFGEKAIADFTGGALRYYVAVGAIARLIERYTELTGRAPLPPKWALGYHQSRWGYRTEEAIRETVKEFREKNLPLSAIHLDIDVQVGFRAFTIDPDRFPNLNHFTKELEMQGVQFITIINPGIKYSRQSNLFLEGQLLGAFCRYPDGKLVVAPVWPGWCVFPDFTHPVVRKWWSRQYQYLLDVGVGGFWHDMNEPAAFIAWGDRSLPKVAQHFMEGRGGDHREAHNVYGLLQAEAAYESLCKYRPHRRPFIVSRAGWAGLQRYAWMWTGDIECTWAALRQTVATVVGLGLSGIPYSGPDIGGFQGNPPAELYLRWFQLSTFLTFYRSHCSNNVEYRAPWTYGEPYLSIIREFLQLRYRLMPYFYTLAWEASQTGYPPVRPIFWGDAENQALWSIDDAFLLGDALLVCPIVEEGGRSRKVTLPNGGWYNFWNDEQLTGGKEVEIAASLEQIPLLVRAGSILPMEEGTRLILHLYAPSSESRGEAFEPRKFAADSEESNTNALPVQAQLYSDAGDGYAESRLDRFEMAKSENGWEITWESQGEFALPYDRVELHLHGFAAKQAWIDGEEVEIQGQSLECDRFERVRLLG